MSERAPTTTGYAGLVTRAVALLIDVVVIDVIALLLGGAVNLILSVFGITGKINLVAAVAGGLAWLVWSGAYFVIFWTLTGQTPGARLMRIRVVRPGSRIGFVRAVRRFGGLLFQCFSWGPDSSRSCSTIGAAGFTIGSPAPSCAETNARATWSRHRRL